MSHVPCPTNMSPPPTTFAVYAQLLKLQLMSFPEMTPLVTSSTGGNDGGQNGPCPPSVMQEPLCIAVPWKVPPV